MKPKSQVGPRHGTKPMHHLTLAEIDTELIGSANFGNNFDCGYQTLVSHLCSLLLESLVALNIAAGGVNVR